MKFCRFQILFALVVVVLGTASALSACGQKGELYLPGKQAPAQKKN